MSQTPQQIKKRYDTLKAQQGSYCSTVDDVCRYFSPELETVTKTSNGAEVDQPITSTGIVATNTLVSGLFSNTTTMAKGNIHDRDAKRGENPELDQWYKELSQLTSHAIAGSDFSQKYRSFLAGYVPRGTGIMFVGYDSLRNKPLFRTYSPCDCAWEFDLDGNVIEFHRAYSATAEQLVEEFGVMCLPSEILKAYNESTKQKFKMLHSVMQRKMGEWEDKAVNPMRMRFEDTHINLDHNYCVKQGGTNEMRYLVARFYTKENEVTGRSPAMQSYQSIRTLSRCIADFYDSVEFAAGPPTFMPDRDAVEDAVMEPFTINYFNPAKGQPWAMPVNTAGIQGLEILINSCMDEINKLHFVDIFLALEQAKGNKTAYEVSELVAERVQSLAPVANSLSKFFSDLYMIVASDLIAYKRIEDSPVETPRPVVTYTSRLDVRLSEVETDALLAASTRVAQFDQLVQGSDLLKAKTEPLEATNEIFKAFNVPSKAIVNDSLAKRRLTAITKAKADAAAAEAKANVMAPIDPQKAPEQGSLMSNPSEGEVLF